MNEEETKKNNKAIKLFEKEEKSREKLIKSVIQNAIKVTEKKPEKIQENFEEFKTEEIKEEEDLIEPEEQVNEKNPEKQIVDLSLSTETRIKALNLFYVKFGEGDTIEAINRISMMYDMSNSSILREYLLAICNNSTISSFLKSLVATSLVTKKYELGEDCLFVVYKNLDTTIATSYKLDLLKLLMKSEKYKESCLSFFLQIIEDMSITEEFRYKSIISLTSDFFLKQGLLAFLRNEKNKNSFRILSAQNLFSREVEKTYVESVLISMLKKSENLTYNERADICDILLKYGTNENKVFALNTIKELGVGNKKIVTLYGNAQNVHNEKIEESVINILEKLHSSDFKCEETSLEKIIDSVKKLITDKSKLENISLSLDRICIDRALYSKYYCSLAQILVKVWNYIQQNKDKEEMQKRLLEELYDMCGICSTGFLSRLVNCISGFGDFSLSISWKDQIISNITGRLNAQIRDMDNIRLSELIIEEMTLESSDFEKRKHFLKFFRKVIPHIRNEMEEEFKEHISSEDFDLYFRAGIMMYETGSEV